MPSTTQAEADFRAAVKQAPQNGWALYGLLEVQRARGDQPGVREAAAALDRAWVGDRELLKLPRL